MNPIIADAWSTGHAALCQHFREQVEDSHWGRPVWTLRQLLEDVVTYVADEPGHVDSRVVSVFGYGDERVFCFRAVGKYWSLVVTPRTELADAQAHADADQWVQAHMDLAHALLSRVQEIQR